MNKLTYKEALETVEEYNNNFIGTINYIRNFSQLIIIPSPSNEELDDEIVRYTYWIQYPEYKIEYQNKINEIMTKHSKFMVVALYGLDTFHEHNLDGCSIIPLSKLLNQ